LEGCWWCGRIFELVPTPTYQKRKNVLYIALELRSLWASIFDRFTQVNSPDRREKNGTGLGLSIVKALVESQGGTIEFESQLGKGTKFSFEIPKPNTTQMDVQTSGFQVAAQ